MYSHHTQCKYLRGYTGKYPQHIGNSNIKLWADPALGSRRAPHPHAEEKWWNGEHVSSQLTFIRPPANISLPLHCCHQLNSTMMEVSLHVRLIFSEPIKNTWLSPPIFPILLSPTIILKKWRIVRHWQLCPLFIMHLWDLPSTRYTYSYFYQIN